MQGNRSSRDIFLGVAEFEQNVDCSSCAGQLPPQPFRADNLLPTEAPNLQLGSEEGTVGG